MNQTKWMRRFESSIGLDSSTRKRLGDSLSLVIHEIGLSLGRLGSQSPQGKPRPRPLTHRDVDGWFEAAAHSKPPRSSEQIKMLLVKRNAYRWRLMMKQYKFFSKQMVKMGLNPEDLRWLL